MAAGNYCYSEKSNKSEEPAKYICEPQEYFNTVSFSQAKV